MPRLSFASNGSSGGSDTNDSGELTLGTRFSVTALGGKLVGYRFRYPWGVVAPDNVGSFALYDTTTSGQVSGSLMTGVPLKLGDSSNGGWHTIDLPTPIDLVENQIYLVAAYMPSAFRSMARPALNGTTQPDRGFLKHHGCRFIVNGSAAMAYPTNASSAYYYIEPIVQVPSLSSFTGSAGSWTFNYASEAAMNAAGWTFVDVDGTDTDAGGASYSPSGLTITPNSSGSANILHKALPSNWSSIVVKYEANPNAVVGRGIRIGLANATESMYTGIDMIGAPINGGNSSYDQVSAYWGMTARGYNSIQNLGSGVSRWVRIDRDYDTDLLTYMFSFNGVDWLIPIETRSPKDKKLATRIPQNIDASDLFISGMSPDAWSYKVQEVHIQGTPATLPVAQGSIKTYDNKQIVKIYHGSQQIAAGYRGSVWNFQPTMDGEYVGFTVTGPSFRPKIDLLPGSTAQCLWTLDDGKVFASGLNPDLDFNISDTREVRLYVRDGNLPAFDQVTVLNLGYDSSEDPGTYGPGPTHNYPPQSVVEITNLVALTNLQMFMAAHSSLVTVPFTGMSNLEFIEVYAAEVEAVDLTGCDSLIRLCLEQTRVGTVDLNPVAATLRDIRWAAIRGLSAPATIAPLTGTMAQLYHYCVRNNIGLVGNLSFTQMPVIEERWDWECSIASIEGTIPNTLRSYQTYGNPYTSAEMDEIYVGLDVAGRTNGLLYIQAGLETPAAPGSSGSAARANLIAKGWTITS